MTTVTIVCHAPSRYEVLGYHDRYVFGSRDLNNREDALDYANNLMERSGATSLEIKGLRHPFGTTSNTSFNL